MKKNKKRINWSLAIMAMLTAGLFLSACQKNEPSRETPTTSAAVTSTETPVEEETQMPVLEDQRAIWMDAGKTVDERVEALLSVMTLEEKAAQMVQPEQNEAAGGPTLDQIREYGIGSVFSGGGSAPSSGNTVNDWSVRINQIKQAAMDSRLGIPLIYGVDAVHGNNNVEDAVIFPHNIGLASTRDTALVEQIGAITAKEVRAVGIQWTFAPVLGVVDNERWGRFYEAFGENAELVTEMGAAYVRGLQGQAGQPLAADKTVATAKHYIGEGQTLDGMNKGEVQLSKEEFAELLVTRGILKPYEEAINSGVRTVMVSFNSVSGVNCHENYHLVTEVLKGERTDDNPLGLGFTGFVVSDYDGTEMIVKSTYEEKIAACINAGVDLLMEPFDWKECINAILYNVENSEITQDRIDDAVRRILRVKFEMGLFEQSMGTSDEKQLLDQFGSDEHRAVARQAVSESLVLLKNDKFGKTGKTALELLGEAKNIAVAGEKADNLGTQCGGWTISWRGSSTGERITAGTTILEGIQNQAGDRKIGFYADGKVKKGVDAVIVVVGEPAYVETEGDRLPQELKLPEEDLEVIKNVKRTVKDAPIILVLTTGRPLSTADFIDDVDGLVEAWLPGSEGDGIADVLIGDQDFSGELPVTWTWYPEDITEKLLKPELVLFPYGTGLKKDGSSVNEGQTVIPDRPAAPEDRDK